MKYLSNYIEDKQTEAFDKYGAFFAFNDNQFKENRKEGVKYTLYQNIGLFVPKKYADKLMKTLDKITEEGIKQDIEENGIENIIKRELYNHEAFYTGRTEDTAEALKEYNITREQIQKVYAKELPTACEYL
jgi:hypothetical protein